MQDAKFLYDILAAFNGTLIYIRRQGLVPLDGRYVYFPDLAYSFNRYVAQPLSIFLSIWD